MPMLRYNKRWPKCWIHKIRQEQLRRTLEQIKVKDIENGEQMLTFFIDAECAIQPLFSILFWFRRSTII